MVPFPLLLVRCKTWFGQIKLLRNPVILIHGIHGCKEYRLSFPAWILSKLTAHPIWYMYSKKLFGINTLSWRVGSMGFPPEWPWRVGWVKNFLSWWISTILKSFLVASRLLSSCSSTFHQTNIESAQMCSEDHLSVSRIRSHHLLLEAFLRAEEECSVFLRLGTLDQIELLVQYQSIFFHGIGTALVDEQVEVGLLGFALSFERLAFSNTSVFNANNSVFVSEFSCSSSSYSLSIKSVTNLFNPSEILNHEWELTVCNSFPIPTPYLPCK